MPTETPRVGALARLSLRQKLPLMMGGLLLVVALAIAAFAYRAVSATTTRFAEARLVAVATQFRDIFKASSEQVIARATGIARDPAIATFAYARPGSSRRAALVALEPKSAQPDPAFAVELRGGDGRVILTTTKGGAAVPLSPRAPVRGDSAVIGPLQLLNDTLVYAVVAPIPGGDVHLVRWRRATGSRNGRQQLTQLIGAQVTLFLGNADGSAWTNFERPSPGPLLDTLKKGPVHRYQRDGASHVGAVVSIPNTPWTVVVDLPWSTMNAPAALFLRSIIVITLVALLVALIIAWGVSRRLTSPIVQLADAADGIAGGDYSRSVDIRRADELGRLGRSFNGMVSQVRQLTGELEHRVTVRTADLNAANKELDSFAYAVSHDLRTPLRALDGFSQALLEDYGGQLDDTGRDYLARIRRGSQRMGDLIDALLDLSRVARSELRRESVDLSAMAEDIVAALRETSPDRTVETTIAPSLTTTGDPRMLRALLQNLIANAWKFTSRTTRARIDFKVHEDNGHGRVHVVRDNGAGFDMAYASKLFGAFQRLHDAKDFEGTGVGLATVQRIIHRHGGTIWAEGAPNQGAAFYFTLG